jgi:hypothetical protein
VCHDLNEKNILQHILENLVLNALTPEAFGPHGKAEGWCRLAGEYYMN